jgi:glycosyltransferase involved in cell wall biosynthesis
MPDEEWLILAHAFNMDGRAASHTITDKIPHLVAQGVRPVVLSAVTGRRDTGVEHHQLLALSPAALRFDLRHVLRRRVGHGLAYNAILGAVSLVLLPFYLLEKAFVRLEPHWSWGGSAYWRAARIIRERRPAVLYSTGGANSAHWAGYRLARRFNLPWIAEVHDPMVMEGGGRTRMAEDFARRLEARICERADVAIWFTEEALAQARARNPVLGDRGHVMIPGADAPQAARVAYRPGEHFVIGHFGSLSTTRHLGVFAEALRRLIGKDPSLAGVVRLEIYGSEPDAISREALRTLPAGVVEVKGRLEQDPDTGESGRERVVKRMNAVDCLLLLHGTEPFCSEYIPSKLYEYLWTQRPILALVWRNPQMARMLAHLGHVAVAADDAAALEAALGDLVGRWRRGELPDSGRASPYTVDVAVRQLVGWGREAAALPLRRGYLGARMP